MNDQQLAFRRFHSTLLCWVAQMSGMSAKAIRCGVPQGSILGPFLFSIYINDLPNYLGHATPRLFAEDTSLIVAGESVEEMKVKNGWKKVS